MAAIDPGVRMSVSLSDRKIVQYQLKREDIRFLGVTVRCRFNCPAVIAQDPFFTRNIIFPTIHYLCCPRLVRLVGRLESSPFFKTVKAGVREGGPWRGEFLSFLSSYRSAVEKHVGALYERRGERLFRKYRLFTDDGASSFLFEADNNSGEQKNEAKSSYLDDLLKRGLAGSASDEAIKCLHALYAFILSFGPDPAEPGIAFFKRMLEGELREKFAGDLAEIF